MPRRITVLLLILGFLASTGCARMGGPGAVSAPRDAGTAPATPRDALLAMHAALLHGDRDSFLACWKADGDQRTLLSAVFDASQLSLKLKDALEKAYGPEGWVRFKGPGGGTGVGLEGLDRERLGRAEVVDRGDVAIVKIPDEEQPVALVRVDGKWYLDTASMLPPRIDPKDFSRVVELMKAPVEQVMSRVGETGQTPESLADLFRREMVKSLAARRGAGARRDG
jgi:hypothetical protein